jgi:hypothetical protein
MKKIYRRPAMSEVTLRFHGGPLDGYEQKYPGRAEDGWGSVLLIGIASLDGTMLAGYRRRRFNLFVRGDGLDGWISFEYETELEVEPGQHVRVIRLAKEL